MFILLSCTPTDNKSRVSENDNASTLPAGKLFLKTTMYGSSLDISWVYLGNDGEIVKDPKHGVNPINISAERVDNVAYTGTYKVVGSNFQITWKNGKSETWSFEKTKGEYSSINGGIVTQPSALPINYKLTGSYAAGAVTANLSASSTLTFTADGKFKEARLGAVSTNETGASAADKRQGTYTITGNTLKLKYNSGENYVAVVGIYKISTAITYFIINSTSYRQQ